MARRTPSSEAAEKRRKAPRGHLAACGGGVEAESARRSQSESAARILKLETEKKDAACPEAIYIIDILYSRAYNNRQS